jgi:sulfatase modifying factor 1
MSYYVFGCDVSYSDYLKAKSFLSADAFPNQKIRLDISKHTRAIIATPANLSRHRIELLASSDEIDGLDSLLYDVSSMLTAKGEVTAKIHCAYYNLQVDALIRKNELETLDKPKMFTASNRYYDHALNAYKQGSYSEALDELLKGISEINPASKFVNEWQFYQLLGTLYLGFSDCDVSLVDLAKAEQAFIKLAQLTKDDQQPVCAKAYMAAGWAAYCQGRFSEASEFMENSITMSRTLAEARFIMAKILIAQNDIEKAFVYLGKAIESDPFYAIKASGEADFQKHEDSLIALLVSVSDKYAFYLTNLNHDFDSRITDKDVVSMLHSIVENTIADKSLFNYIAEYKRLCKAVWIITEESYVSGEIRNVVVKQDSWYSNKVIEQVKDEYSIRSLNYHMIGNKHSIELAFSCNFVELQPGHFHMGRTLVTQGLWNIVMGAKTFPVSGANYPVYEVNWYDCVKFCNKLSKLLNLPPYYHISKNYDPVDWCKGEIECDFSSDGFRLPTELEWEYAAKGGLYTHKFPYSGSNDPNDVAWHDKNSKGKIQPVAQKKPNELGLYDMSGNVWEWCWNNWNETDRRILRGGAFFSSSNLCAVSGRGHGSAANPGIANGFRLVRNAENVSDN